MDALLGPYLSPTTQSDIPPYHFGPARGARTTGASRGRRPAYMHGDQTQGGCGPWGGRGGCLAARYAAGRPYVGCLHCLRQLQGGFDRRNDPKTDLRDLPLSIYTSYRQAITIT
eukprot:SAG22_NODE_934_length_6428_cov_3.928267_9_plen_114_part_00